MSKVLRQVRIVAFRPSTHTVRRYVEWVDLTTFNHNRDVFVRRVAKEWGPQWQITFEFGQLKPGEPRFLRGPHR